jgi:hypothetical protein
MSYLRISDDLYWMIGDDPNRLWSNRYTTIMTSDDPRYVEWTQREKAAALRASSDEELAEHLHAFGQPGPVARPEWVVEERDRRMALGFDHDFGDVRGVHRIGTTKLDMEGWAEVTTVANAAINIGMPSAAISIATDTGPVVVTAAEWQVVLLAAARFRQPLWAKSFTLQAMDPIPVRFRDDEYWR